LGEYGVEQVGVTDGSICNGWLTLFDINNDGDVFETTSIICLPRYVTEFEFHVLVYSVKPDLLVYCFYLASKCGHCSYAVYCP
jgi:hypothetical protein